MIKAFAGRFGVLSAVGEFLVEYKRSAYLSRDGPIRAVEDSKGGDGSEWVVGYGT